METLHLDADRLDADRLDPLVVPEMHRSSSLMHGVNSNLRALSETFVRADPIAFFCECRDPRCYAAVWMSVAAFDAAAGTTTWLLSEGHEPSALWHAQRPFPTDEVVHTGDRAAPTELEPRRPTGRRWGNPARNRPRRSREIGVALAGEVLDE